MKEKILRKMFILTLTMLIILSVYTIPTIGDKHLLRTNLEMEDITNLNECDVYLLNGDNLLVKAKMINEGVNTYDKIKNIIGYLKVDNNNMAIDLRGYLSNRVKVNRIEIEKDIVKIDFSKGFLENEVTITGLVYSLTSLNSISKVKITIVGEELKKYPEILDRKIGINNKYLYHTRKNINKVVVYYLDNISSNNYVPVTKYLNDNREKIEIILDELKNNQELVSLIDDDLRIINYQNENNVLFVNFNKKINKDAVDEITHSIFENYDVNMVVLEVNGKKQTYRKKR